MRSLKGLFRLFIISIVVLLCFATSGRAQDKGFGIGIIAGEPTGLSFKIWVDNQHAVDAGLSWSFRRSGFVTLHADYLWHFPHVIKSSERFVLYAGVGGRFGADRHDAILGIRVPVGLAWWPRGVPLDVFVEFAPVLDLIPATELTANAGIGARFFF